MLLFSESATRFVLEVQPEHFDAVAKTCKGAGIRFGVIGTITAAANLRIRSTKAGYVMDEPVMALKESWLRPLDW